MKSIRILVGILRFFGCLSIVYGLLLIFLDWRNVGMIFSGLVWLALAHGLSKKEKWAWYTAFVVFVIGFLFVVAVAFLIKFWSWRAFLSMFIYILYFGLLIKGRQLFIEQPKEKVSQWFHKPCFVIVLVGTLISYLIFGGFLVYYYFRF